MHKHASRERPLFGIMWVSFAHLRSPGHIMPDHAGDRGAVFLVLAPHDHLHIKQIRSMSGVRGGLMCTPGLAIAGLRPSAPMGSAEYPTPGTVTAARLAIQLLRGPADPCCRGEAVGTLTAGESGESTHPITRIPPRCRSRPCPDGDDALAVRRARTHNGQILLPWWLPSRSEGLTTFSDQASELDFLVAGRDLVKPRPLGYEGSCQVHVNLEVRAAPRSRVSRASVHSVEHASRGTFRYVPMEDEQ
jgi:hypothetical protein